jgi:hypothetical protein
MAGFTNKGKMRLLEWALRGGTIPANFYVALFTAATAPTADINTKSELTEIASGNGYTTGGILVDNNTTDFDVLTEDDGNDRGFIQIKDLVWTASGGALPASGAGARYACLTDANATQGSREILFYWDLGADYSVSSGQTLTLQNLEIRINES